MLTELAGIPRTADPDGRLAPTYSATIRHASRLLFQSQNEISSNTLLFHRQSDDFVKASIRDTLPFFLGAVDADDLALARRLADRRRELAASNSKSGTRRPRGRRRLSSVEAAPRRHRPSSYRGGRRSDARWRAGCSTEAIARLQVVTIDDADDREIDAARPPTDQHPASSASRPGCEP